MLRRTTFTIASFIGLMATTVGLPLAAIPQQRSAQVDGSHLVQFLNQTIAWYRELGPQQQLVSDANDAIFVSGNRETADQVVRLVFQFAHAEEQWQSAHSTQANASNPVDGSAYASLLTQEAKAEQDANQVQGEVEDMKKKMTLTSGDRRKALEAQLAETQSEVDLARARAEAIQNMAQFVANASQSSNGLRAEIDALANTLPSGITDPPTASSTSANASVQSSLTPATNTTSGGGLWEQGVRLFSTWGKLRTIDGLSAETQALARSSQDIRGSMTAQLKQLTDRGDQLAQEADTANALTLGQEKQQLDALTQEFKQLTAAAVPIAKAGVLLDIYQKNVANWRTSVMGELFGESRGLIVRVLLISLLVAAVLGASELWRRAIFHYARDVRRRSQLHWVRKFVTWFVIGVIIALSFASRLGSVATFAGLLTAGIAVALQNVIQSVVGYFLLIGKYGIRAGDRVQIGGVTGEVIEVGLVRIHVMEMGGLSEDAPTGRVVAFSNSIVFQPAAGIFKQIPGTSFAWHEIALTLPADTNFVSARERLMKAVETGLAPFKEEIARQHAAMQSSFEVTGGDLAPSVQLQFTPGGIEAKARYPVALRHSLDIDESVTHALLTDLDLPRSNMPNIRLKTSPS